MTPSESEAVEAFERLGLTSYESKVFIALQQLGSGTARDVARVTDVPRSQVYSVSESLEDRGLLEVQQSSPIRYRPVSVEEARSILRDRFESEQERAFEYVETVRQESVGEEAQENIWTVRGRERVDDRVVDLVTDSTDRVVFGARLPALVTDEIVGAVEARAEDGADVHVLSRSAAVRSLFDDHPRISVTTPPEHRSEDERSGRIVLADDDTILLSVVDEDETETAIWSAGSLFASVLIQLIEESAEAPTS
ncbi:helix-turn-helix domain-containing protein [Halovivax sp.]|uniref:TrmB family transcriptional regulator n=1 Tax=Halovivax sp. TaxID=1935978 RepID=UPI0025BF026E|nr:helix-turn-helix domain-containing protein [Halovivax sp.]